MLLSNWTNAWIQQDFRLTTQGDQPASEQVAGPGWVGLEFLADSETMAHVRHQVEEKMRLIKDLKNRGVEGYWAYYDSGASRSVMGTNSSLRGLMKNVRPASGSCVVGNGKSLQYLERGDVTANNEFTVVEGLRYDLYAAVAAAKRGVTSVIDFDMNTGKNNCFSYCKLTGTATPPVERKKGVLEVPIGLQPHERGLISMAPAYVNKSEQDECELTTAEVSTFWYAWEHDKPNLLQKDDNTTDGAYFVFDLVSKLGQRQRDFLIHARLAHLSRVAILQLVKRGGLNLPYSGKFKELCRPCLEARQRAGNHGVEHDRHPNAKSGEHLHSDLAIVNHPDFGGNTMVLTVVDEKTDEVAVSLLKTKTADNVLQECKRIHKIIKARTGNKLKTWQFDRGPEFLNKIFNKWIEEELGATQRFSNIEHPWENGRAERSFGTIFSKARSMMKHADLPNGTWGKAVIHAVYLKNRSPSSRLNGMPPLQYRTGEPFDYGRLRVFGCPAQIYIRNKNRVNGKLSDRSEKGTLMGMSTKGNEYIFRVPRTNEIAEVDSKDALFNENFDDCRDRKGKLIPGGRIMKPDLTVDPEEKLCLEPVRKTVRFVNMPNRFEILSEDGDQPDNGRDDVDDDVDIDDEANVQMQPQRPVRIRKPKNRFVPGTTNVNMMETNHPPPHPSDAQILFPNDALLPRDQMSDTELNSEQAMMIKAEVEHLMSAMESPSNPDWAFVTNEAQELLDHFHETAETDKDPTTQKQINKMTPDKAKRFNDSTRNEFEGMLHKEVIEYTRITQVPKKCKVYPCVVNWTTKLVLGVYSKTKCRLCFGGHLYDKRFTDCFAPTVNFMSVLVMLCLAAMFSWYLGSLDYSQAYLNADIDEECYMRAPEFLREYDVDGIEFVWKLK